MRYIQRAKSKHGFTLVEVVIVLVIIALLASILSPSYMRYIERARKKDLETEMMGIYNAAQAALTEYYTYNTAEVQSEAKKYYFKDTRYGKGTTYCGRISDYMFIYAQYPQLELPADISYVNMFISQRVLEYLESDSSQPQPKYRFNRNYAGNRLDGQTAKEYLEQSGHDISINIFFNSNGRIFLIQIARDGYLVTMSQKGVETEYDGKSLKSYQKG